MTSPQTSLANVSSDSYRSHEDEDEDDQGSESEQTSEDEVDGTTHSSLDMSRGDGVDVSGNPSPGEADDTLFSYMYLAILELRFV